MRISSIAIPGIHFGGILAKQLYGIPLVITTHSLEPLRPWKREQLGLRSLLLDREDGHEMADCIIAVSHGMKDDVLHYFNVSPDRVKVLYNGIDTDEYQPVSTQTALENRSGAPYANCLMGRITRQKRDHSSG